LHASPNLPGDPVLVVVLEGEGEAFLHAASKSAAESMAASSAQDFVAKHASWDSVCEVAQSCLHCSPLTLAGAPHSVAFDAQRCTQSSVCTTGSAAGVLVPESVSLPLPVVDEHATASAVVVERKTNAVTSLMECIDTSEKIEDERVPRGGLRFALERSRGSVTEIDTCVFARALGSPSFAVAPNFPWW
jgi:hypothetical protein